MRARIGPGLMSLALVALASVVVASPCAWAQAPAAPTAKTDPAKVDIVYLALTQARTLPLSYLDQPPADEGLQ